MIDEKYAHLPYRPCVGIMLVNADNQVFVAKRNDNRTSKWRDAWQMPQGGIDKGEDAQVAAFRELEEETGVAADSVKLIAQSKDEHFYELPAELLGKLWKGKWRGQRQYWFLMRYLGEDKDINIDTEIPEFSEWKWSKIDALADNVVPFKRIIYQNLAQEFSAILKVSND